jgi:proteic killer suppression protein
MIGTFGDSGTEDLFHGRSTNRVRRFPPEIIKLALVKLDMLNAAIALMDLRSPPGNRLEALKADFFGCYSIRVNDQWRIVFRWENGTAYEVRLLDYHG